MKSIVTKNKPRGGGGVRASGAPPHPPNGGLVLYHTYDEKKTNYGLLNTLIQNQKSQNNTTIKYAYNRKLIQYGNYFDLITYSESRYLFDKKISQSSKKFREIDEINKITYFDFSWFTDLKRRSDSISRTRNYVTRIIQCNIDSNPTMVPVFVTLTFKKNITTPQQANKYFHQYTKRLTYYIKKKPEYLAVIEFQKKGRVHYHIVYFNLPFINKNKFEKIWKNGFSKIEVPKNIQDVTKYVGKYMTKELIDKRLVGQKAYFTSKGLQRPIHTLDPELIDSIVNSGSIKLLETFQGLGIKINKYKYD